MMRIVIFGCILTFFTILNCFSQIITVVDNEDLKPISDVAVLNESKTKFILTNRSGKADISSFGDKEMICFQHFTFERVCLSRDEIKKTGFEIKLTRKIFAIEEFVISANRWEQNKNEVPNKITTVLKPAVELQNPQTAADLIGISDEVYIQKSQLGGGSPMIRGFATNRILIVVDGVRMNNAIYREGNIHNVISLDPSVIESTEIIFGPGASVYGSDAIGGVMDFHTKKALFSTGEKLYIKADAFTRFSSANKEKTGHFDFNAGSKRLAFLTSISWSSFGNLKMGSKNNPDYVRQEYVAQFSGLDSIIPNPDPLVQMITAYDQLNTMNKLRYKISENIDLVYTNHYSRLSNVPRYDRLIQYKTGNLRYGDWYYGPQVWVMNNLQITIRKEHKMFDEIRLIAAHQKYRESRHDRSFGKISTNEQFENVSILSLNLDFDKKINKEKELVYYGLELVNNRIKSVAQTRTLIANNIAPAGSRYPNGDNKYNSFSLYAGYKNNLSDMISLNTGIRYNHVRLYSTIADNSFYNFPFTTISISNGAITGAAGIVFRVKEKMQVNLNTSTGFRAPNLDDAGKVFDSAPGVVVVPNPSLEPEYAYNIDLGVSKDFGEFLHVDFTAFHTWLTNAMIRHDFLFDGHDSIMYGGELSKVEAITNAGSARVYGFHIIMQANITDNLSLKTIINITEGKEKNGVPLRHAAPVFGSTHLTYERSKLKADFYSSYNGPKKFEKMPPSEIEKPYMYATDENGNPWSPGWVTLNFKFSYSFFNRIMVNTGVENILDVRYRPYSSGIVAPGRNFIISLRVII
ncbi:MAG: TonB-dependent receptor [Bacteroidota bacterium]